MSTLMSTRRCIFRMAFMVAILLLLPIAVPAQQTTGGITGVVTDAQGGVLVGAKVDVVGDQTGLRRSQVSGGNGYYSFVNLPIGHVHPDGEA